jgi:hypothetical protein
MEVQNAASNDRRGYAQHDPKRLAKDPYQCG